MKLVFVGLGKMGGQLVAKLVASGHEVIALDPNPAAVAAAVSSGAIAAKSRQEALQAFQGASPIVWLMIPSSLVRQEVAEWLAILPPGSTLVDGGNSNYHHTIGRASAAKRRGIQYVDVGTSGGVLGLVNGFSLMVGGERSEFDKLQPLLEVLSVPKGSFIHAGPSGAGHYVKMIHNGIEYSMMQAYAEGYQLLKEGKDFPGLNLSGIAEIWQHGSIVASRLNGLAAQILKTSTELEHVNGFVAATGEAHWTLETAKRQGVEMPALAAALKVREDSQAGKVSYATKLLAALRNAFGGHSVNK